MGPVPVGAAHGRREVSPGRALRTGMLLYAIASDERLRDAKQLRKVTMVDDAVDLQVDARWPELDASSSACGR